MNSENKSRLIPPKARERVESAIAEAEARTSAEIVCAVARESGRYDRAEAIVGVLGSLLALCGSHLLYTHLFTPPGDWSGEALAIGWQALAVVAGFVIGHLVAGLVPPLRRLFVREKEIEAEVEQAAWHVFAMAAIRGTTGRSGLLIYVSRFERRVMILADRASREALGDERIQAIRDQAVERLRSGRLADSLADTVRAAGETLAESLPAEREVNPNELADHVLLFDPRPS